MGLGSPGIEFEFYLRLPANCNHDPNSAQLPDIKN